MMKAITTLTTSTVYFVKEMFEMDRTKSVCKPNHSLSFAFDRSL
jgi:hypothetical protein